MYTNPLINVRTYLDYILLILSVHSGFYSVGYTLVHVYICRYAPFSVPVHSWPGPTGSKPTEFPASTRLSGTGHGCSVIG